MLAFLLRHELYKHAKTSTGTVALTLMNDGYRDSFLVSTKYDVPAEIVSNVLNAVVAQAVLQNESAFDFAYKKGIRQEFDASQNLVSDTEACAKDRNHAGHLNMIALGKI
jgi:hypothetical protein